MTKEIDAESFAGIDEQKYNFIDEAKPVFRTRKGLDAEIVKQISAKKRAPSAMT